MSKKKIIRPVAIVVALALCLCFSVRFEPLTARRAELAGRVFSPEQVLDRFWNEELDGLLEQALDLAAFETLLAENPQELIEKYGRTLGIGAPYSFVVRGEGTLGEAGDESVALTASSGRFRYQVLTGPIFSNTVREASGSFNIDAFENTMDFNTVAAGINGRIVADIVDPIRERLTPGARVRFYGAVDVDLRRLDATEFEIVPLKIEIQSHE